MPADLYFVEARLVDATGFNPASGVLAAREVPATSEALPARGDLPAREVLSVCWAFSPCEALLAGEALSVCWAFSPYEALAGRGALATRGVLAVVLAMCGAVWVYFSVSLPYVAREV